MSLAGCQINSIDVSFHLQKSLEILIKSQLTKSDPKRTRRWKYHTSCQLRLTCFLLMWYVLICCTYNLPTKNILLNYDYSKKYVRNLKRKTNFLNPWNPEDDKHGLILFFVLFSVQPLYAAQEVTWKTWTNDIKMLLLKSLFNEHSLNGNDSGPSHQSVSLIFKMYNVH